MLPTAHLMLLSVSIPRKPLPLGAVLHAPLPTPVVYGLGFSSGTPFRRGLFSASIRPASFLVPPPTKILPPFRFSSSRPRLIASNFFFISFFIAYPLLRLLGCCASLPDMFWSQARLSPKQYRVLSALLMPTVSFWFPVCFGNPPRPFRLL